MVVETHDRNVCINMELAAVTILMPRTKRQIADQSVFVRLSFCYSVFMAEKASDGVNLHGRDNSSIGLNLYLEMAIRHD